MAKVGGQAWQAGKTHCKHGHEFTPGNTRIREDRGSKAKPGAMKRECLTCARLRSAENREKARDLRAYQQFEKALRRQKESSK